MDNFDRDSEGNCDFAERSLSFAVATTPLSALDAGGDFDFRVTVNDNYIGQVGDNGDEDTADSSDNDEDRYHERFVQPDGSVVIVLRADGGGADIHKDTNSHTSSKPIRAHSSGHKVVKLRSLATNVMATVIQPPGRVHAPGAIQTEEWSAGLCGCLEFCTPNCCMVTFCPCISTAQIATRIGFRYISILIVFGFVVGLDLLTYALAVWTMSQSNSNGYYYHYSSTRLAVWGYIAIVATIVTCLAFFQLRLKVRGRFRLPGSACEDLCVSCFCPCCSLAQMATHVKSYKPGSCDFGPPDELPAYN